MKEQPDNVVHISSNFHRSATDVSTKSPGERLAQALEEVLPDDSGDPCDGCEHASSGQSIVGNGNIQIGGGSSVRQWIRGNGNIQICG